MRGSPDSSLCSRAALAHRLEHVEVVVAGGAIGAEADRHLARRSAGTGAVPLASSLLSALWDTPTPRFVQNVDVLAVRVDGVRGERSRSGNPSDSEVGDRRGLALLGGDLHLVLRLREVKDDGNVSAIGELARTLQGSASAYTSCGATAGTIRSSDANSLMKRSVRDSPSSGVSRQGPGT